jgi:hypothetical protein
MSRNPFWWVFSNRRPPCGRGQKKHRIFYTLDTSFAYRGEHIKAGKTGEQVVEGQFYGNETLYRLDLEVQ